MSDLCVECGVEPRLPRRRYGQECFNAKERVRSKQKYRNESPERRQARREATARWKFKTLYGISHEEYDRLLTDQRGVCSICGEKCSSGKKLAVDHCHRTGKVRGLLCGNCNRGIGQLGEDIERLEGAIRYLKENS